MISSQTSFDILKNEKFFLIFLFILSFLIRLFLFETVLVKEKRYLYGDGYGYNSVAMRFASGKGITLGDGKYNFERVPGYFIFLGILHKLFGDERIVVRAHIFLSSFLPILIFFFALALFPGSIALAKLSGLWGSFHLGYVLYSGILHQESLFCFLFLLLLISFLGNFNFFFCSQNHKIFTYKKVFVSSILFGILSLVRPIGHYTMILFIIMMFLSRESILEKCKKAAVFFFVWFGVVFIWLLRNYLLTGFIFFHDLPGHHFLRYGAVPIHAQLVGQTTGKSYKYLFSKELVDLVKQEEKKKQRKLSEIEISHVKEKLAWTYMRNNPMLAIKHGIKEIFRTLWQPHFFMFVSILGDRSHWENLCETNDKSFLNRLYRMLILPCTKDSFLNIIFFLERILYFFIFLGFVLVIFRAFFDSSLFCVLLKTLPIFLALLAMTFVSGVSRLRMPLECFLIVLSLKFWLDLLYSRNSLVIEKKL